MTGFRYWRLRDRYRPWDDDASRTELTSLDDEEEDSRSSGESSNGSADVRGGGGGRSSARLRAAKDRKKVRQAWCRLAYWEGIDRLGDQYNVSSSSVDVFASNLPKGSGFCLDPVFQKFPRPPKDQKGILKARKKIGQGLLVSQDESTQRVWVCNRTKDPIFIHSPTLDAAPNSRTFSVHKIPPDYSVQVFDYDRARALDRAMAQRSRPAATAHAPDGPVDLYSVQISFAKGWGAGYKRQEVTACPCWLQVCMRPPTR